MSNPIITTGFVVLSQGKYDPVSSLFCILPRITYESKEAARKQALVSASHFTDVNFYVAELVHVVCEPSSQRIDKSLQKASYCQRCGIIHNPNMPCKFTQGF